MAGQAAGLPAPVAVASYRLPLATHPATDPAELDERTWMEPLLQENAIWFCRLRWVVIAVLALAGAAGFFPSVLQRAGLSIQPGWPFFTAGLLAGLNLAFGRLSQRPAIPGFRQPVRGVLWAQIIADLLILTAVIHWLGADLPAAPFTYLLHIVLACMVFSPMESFGVAGLAAAFYFGSLWLEAAGILLPSSVVVAAGTPGALASSVACSTIRIIPLLLIWVTIWYLVSRLASTLRMRDRELFLANHQLNASIEERSHHMLQTTHQLKAPFAAIHAQVQLLLGDYCGKLSPEARAVTEKISARCLLLARQIQEMLQLANLRSQGQHTPPRRDVLLGSLVEEIMQRIEPAVRQRGLRIEADLQPVAVHGIDDHLTMLAENLLVNAVNYSFDHGIITVQCQERDPGQVIFSVRDHGIGIPAEKLPRIFDDYYRTEEAVQHNRSSTGLGLAIVRHVACEDSLPIQVESAPGWGTRFTVILRGARAA